MHRDRSRRHRPVSGICKAETMDGDSKQSSVAGKGKRSKVLVIGDGNHGKVHRLGSIVNGRRGQGVRSGW